MSFFPKELENAQIELLKANNFKSNVYIRPLIFLGDGVMGLYHIKAPVRVGIAAWEWGAYLGEEGLEKGIKVKFRLLQEIVLSHAWEKLKQVQIILTLKLQIEAIEAGYEEALMLDEEGFIAEGTGECFFIVKDGVLITPPNDFSLKALLKIQCLK